MTNRIMIRCCLPGSHRHLEIIEVLEKALIVGYGGFTRYSMLGGWKTDEGEHLKEPGCVYEVSFKHEHLVEMAAYLFRVAARAMGEKWCHIERHEFIAMHARVNPSPFKVNQPLVDAAKEALALDG